jgi:AI-2 transport protein TqsA
LIVVLGTAGLLVTTLALQQFSTIVAPVVLGLVLVIGFDPLTGILRRRGVPLWLAVTATLISQVVVVLGLAARWRSPWRSWRPSCRPIRRTSRS